MNPGTAKHLHDAIEACDEIQAYLRDWTQEEFLLTRSLQLIVWKLIDITGDAIGRAERMQPSLRMMIPELDDAIRTLRVAVETCAAGDATLLWNAAQEATPSLRQTLAEAKREARAVSA